MLARSGFSGEVVFQQFEALPLGKTARTAQKTMDNGTQIILNGGLSAGKSALGEALQDVRGAVPTARNRRVLSRTSAVAEESRHCRQENVMRER